MRPSQKIKGKAVKDLYKEWSKAYDKEEEVNPATSAVKDFIIPMVDPQKKDIILDIGCGTGRNTIPLSKRCGKIIGIDFSDDMIRIAKQKSEGINNIKLIKHDLSKKLPFKDKSFDKVLCSLVLNHIKNLERLFAEVKRVLRKGGIFVFDDFSSDLKKPFVTKGSNQVRKLVRDTRKKKTGAFIWRVINEHVYTLHRVDLDITEIRFLRIDEKMKSSLTPSTYKRNKGRTWMFIIKAKK